MSGRHSADGGDHGPDEHDLGPDAHDVDEHASDDHRLDGHPPVGHAPDDHVVASAGPGHPASTPPEPRTDGAADLAPVVAPAGAATAVVAGSTAAGRVDVDAPAAHEVHPDTIVPTSAAEAAAAAADLGRAARRKAAEDAARESAITSRRRALIVAGSVLALLAALVLVWFFLSRSHSDASPQPSPPATPTGPIQPTLLFMLKQSDGIAVGDSLLSVGGRTGRANFLTIPSDVVMDAATGGALPFGEIARLPDANAAANALSDSLGINVNASVSLDTLAFSGLVDAVGGVKVDVDVDVVETQADGSKVVLIAAGKQQLLEGPQAAAYATYLAPGEPEEARMARFTLVLRDVISKLPSDDVKVESIFTGLGASAKSTVPSAQLAAFFVRLHSDVLTDNISYKNLPVKSYDTGGAPAYVVDQDAAAALVASDFPDAVRTPGPNSRVRVLVQNGVGTPGLNASARQLLVDAGFTYVNGANAPALGQAKTAIIVPDSGSASLTWGTDIATALRVPPTAVQVAATGQTVADVIVVLGADFRPASS
jgi:anionic cell wall polymer biosynthesis LytR-Cps2A-Psr (LCP) family protein